MRSASSDSSPLDIATSSSCDRGMGVDVRVLLEKNVRDKEESNINQKLTQAEHLYPPPTRPLPHQYPKQSISARKMSEHVQNVCCCLDVPGQVCEKVNWD